MSDLLSLANVNSFYDTVQVLHHISMTIEKGDFVTILGANGAGKTTIFRSICNMIDVEGEIRLKGRRIEKLNTEEIARLGLGHVPEGRGTFSELSVEENLFMAASIRNDRKEVLEDLKKVFDLFPAIERQKKQLAGNLSGGEQQMLAIGRALMLRPELLMLDEPSIGLAPKIVQEIFRVLQRLNKTDNVTVLLNEQNAAIALRISTKAYLLETGRFVFSGTPETLERDDSIRKAYLGY